MSDELAALVRDEVARQAPLTVATVAAVRSDGAVNLAFGDSIVENVPCGSGYPTRAKGDAVLVAKIAAGWAVVMSLGAAPAAAPAGTKVSWGNGAPSGSGWQQASSVWVRSGEVYAQLATGPAPATDPVTITPAQEVAWRDGAQDSGQDPTQGAWSSYPHPYTSGWFYGTAIAAACSGLSAATMTVRLARSSSRSGSYGDVPVRLYLHSYASAPTGSPTLDDGPESPISLGLGESGSAHLPSSWVSALASGSARGIAVSAGVGSDYLVYQSGCGQITITFS